MCTCWSCNCFVQLFACRCCSIWIWTFVNFTNVDSFDYTRHTRTVIHIALLIVDLYHLLLALTLSVSIIFKLLLVYVWLNFFRIVDSKFTQGIQEVFLTDLCCVCFYKSGEAAEAVTFMYVVVGVAVHEFGTSISWQCTLLASWALLFNLLRWWWLWVSW